MKTKKTSPIDLIRRGIVMASWKDVTDGFGGLTGERLSSPQPTSKSLETVLLKVREQLDAALADYSGPEEVAEQGSESEEEEEEERPLPPVRPPRDDHKKTAADFTIEHTTPTQGRLCRVEEVEVGPGINTWKDTRTLATKEIAESKRLSKKFAPKDHREQYKPVLAQCQRCSWKGLVHPDTVPRRLDPQDEKPAFICNACVGKGA